MLKDSGRRKTEIFMYHPIQIVFVNVCGVCFGISDTCCKVRSALAELRKEGLCDQEFMPDEYQVLQLIYILFTLTTHFKDFWIIVSTAPPPDD